MTNSVPQSIKSTESPKSNETPEPSQPKRSPESAPSQPPKSSDRSPSQSTSSNDPKTFARPFSKKRPFSGTKVRCKTFILKSSSNGRVNFSYSITMENGIQLEFDDVDASVDQVETETETIFPDDDDVDDDDDEYLGCKKYLSAEDLIELAEIKAKIEEDYEADRRAASERKKNWKIEMELERKRAVNMKPSVPIPKADSVQVPKYDSTEYHQTMAKIENLRALIKQQPKDLFTFTPNDFTFCTPQNVPHDFLQFTAPKPPGTFTFPSAGFPQPNPPSISGLYQSQMPRCEPFVSGGTSGSCGYQQAGPHFQSTSFDQAYDLNKGAIPLNPAGTSGAYNGMPMYNSQPPNINMANSYPYQSTMPINTAQSPMTQSFNPNRAFSSINPISPYAPTSMNQSSLSPMSFGMAQSSKSIDPTSCSKYNDRIIPYNTIDRTNMNQSTDSDLADPISIRSSEYINPISLSKATEPIRLANYLAPISSSPTQSNGLMDDSDGCCRI